MGTFRNFFEVWGDVKIGDNIEGLGRLFTVTYNNMKIPLAIDSQGKLWFLATTVEGSFDQLAQTGKENVYWHPLMAGGGEQIKAEELKKYIHDRENIEVSDALDFAYRWLKHESRQRKLRLKYPRKFDTEVDIVNKDIGKPNWITKTQVKTDRLYNPPESQIERRQRRKWGWS